MKKMFNVKIMAEIAIFAALGFVLDILQGAFSNALFPNGGSIGIAFIVVLFISFRRGVKSGFITGLIIGLLQLTVGFYVCSDTWWKNLLQVLFDYVFAYSFVCFAGCFRGLYCKSSSKTTKGLWLSIGAIVGGVGKYASHFISGVAFWPQNESDTLWPRIVYSLSYNGSYMIPSIIITTILFVLIILSQPHLLLDEEVKNKVVSEITNKKAHLVLTLSTLISGSIIFIIFLVLSILESNFYKEYYEYSETHFGRANTYMFILIIGLSFLIVGIYYLIGYIKNKKQSIKPLYLSIYIMSILLITCSISYIFNFCNKLYNKGKDPISLGYDNPSYYLILLIFGIIILSTNLIFSNKYKEEI